MEKEHVSNIEDFLEEFTPPVLIVSTFVGRGMFMIGEAVREKFPEGEKVYHVPIEEYLPVKAVEEDVRRYKFISNNLRFLLYLIYTFPVFYYRKYIREKIFKSTNLNKLHKKIERLNIKTVICVSHRAAFWVSTLKRRKGLGFKVWDILGEYGKNLGYKYLFWSEINGFLSTMEKDSLDIGFPSSVKFHLINLPARKKFYQIAGHAGDVSNVVIVCGFWGQGPIEKMINLLLNEFPQLKINAICGENQCLFKKAKLRFMNNKNVNICGVVEDLGVFLREAASIITKPGISTILEANAADRKIFLLKGMPVAETNNAKFAINNFNAEWFTLKNFKEWYNNEKNN